MKMGENHFEKGEERAANFHSTNFHSTTTMQVQRARRQAMHLQWTRFERQPRLSRQASRVKFSGVKKKSVEWNFFFVSAKQLRAPVSPGK